MGWFGDLLVKGLGPLKLPHHHTSLLVLNVLCFMKQCQPTVILFHVCAKLIFNFPVLSRICVVRLLFFFFAVQFTA